MSEDVILAAPNLKMISVGFTGVDHVPFLCNEKGIWFATRRAIAPTLLQNLPSA